MWQSGIILLREYVDQFPVTLCKVNRKYMKYTYCGKPQKVRHPIVFDVFNIPQAALVPKTLVLVFLTLIVHANIMIAQNNRPVYLLLILEGQECL